MATKLKVSVTEALSFWAGKAKDFFVDGIVPSQEKIGILMERMRKDRDEKREKYDAALAIEYGIFNPDEKIEGSLERAERDHASLTALVAKLADTLVSDTAPASEKNLATKRMENADTKLKALDLEIASLKGNLAQAKETTAMWKKLSDQAGKDLRQLEQLGPILVQQADAARATKAAKLEAMEASAKSDRGSAGMLLEQLTQDLREAQAGLSATTTIEIEETDDGEDILDVAREAESAASSSDRVNAALEAARARKAAAAQPVGAGA